MPSFQSTLSQELLSIPGVMDDGLLGVVVGDAINLTLPTTVAAQTTALTRKPAGSSASVSANGWTCDVAGYFQATVSVAGVSRAILAVAFPISVLTAKVNPNDPNSRTVSRGHLAGVIRDQRVTLTTIAAALEGASAFTLPALLGTTCSGWTQFGPG